MTQTINKVELNEEQKEQLVSKLRYHAQIAHAAAAWGFDPAGFYMNKAADLIEDYEVNQNSSASNDG